MSETTRSFPRQVECGGSPVEVAQMTAADRDSLVAFVATLPPHDLLFLPRDISHPKVVDAWIRAGETIRPVQTDGDRRGYVIAVGDTNLEALERAEAASRLIDVLTE